MVASPDSSVSLKSRSASAYSGVTKDHDGVIGGVGVGVVVVSMVLIEIGAPHQTVSIPPPNYLFSMVPVLKHKRP